MKLTPEQVRLVKEIDSYNGMMVTPERMMDIHTLSCELGEDFIVKVWTVGSHIRTSVIYDNHTIKIK